MEILSRVHAKNLVEWAKDKNEVLVLSADLTSSTEVDAFKTAYPDRFFSMGVAEQNMMSMAAGLAREGFIPMVHTFGVFIYRRAYDQIAMSIAYANLPVKMFGFLPGIMTPGGASHQAIEDVALMRSLPNMTVLDCGDATEVESILDVVKDISGPVYIRMLRGEIPRLFPAHEKFKLNYARSLSTGNDLTLFTSGICTEEALRATQIIKDRGIQLNHYHISTLKPFNDPRVLQAINESKNGIITMENHSVIGGLGTCVAEVMAEYGIGKKLVKLGIQDTFSHGASKNYLMRELEMDALSLVGAVEKIMNRPLEISEADLLDIRSIAVHSDAKAEAL
jgi:transketolase